MADDDPIAVLNKAVAVARAAGLSCTGWTMQGADGAYVAWLFAETEEGQLSLFDEVDVRETALLAAQSCLAASKELIDA